MSKAEEGSFSIARLIPIILVVVVVAGIAFYFAVFGGPGGFAPTVYKVEGTVTWTGRTFSLLTQDRDRDGHDRKEERTEVRGTLSPDGRTITELTLTSQVTGRSVFYQTWREIPGEPTRAPELDWERS